MQSSGKPQKNDVEVQAAKPAVTEEKKPSEGKTYTTCLKIFDYIHFQIKWQHMILMVVVCRDSRCCENML